MKRYIVFILMIVNLLKADSLPEYTLKAAYLYNFALLTNWPQTEQSENFNICFFRQDFGKASQALSTKTLSNRKITLSAINTADEAKECQMIFIRENEVASGEKLIQFLSGLPILVVSENPRQSGSHINIVRKDQKLAFNVNLNSLKASDLTLSSRLLKLAQKIEP